MKQPWLPGPPAPIVKLMGQATHILDREGRPYCRTEDSPLCHGGLNSADCSVCIACAAAEPDAPPKCQQCGYYHDGSPSVVAFFHPAENR